LYKGWRKLGEATLPRNKNILMGLMQEMNIMSYTPFFYLCEQDKIYKKNSENFPIMV
jgi:hypothetical protein